MCVVDIITSDIDKLTPFVYKEVLSHIKNAFMS